MGTPQGFLSLIKNLKFTEIYPGKSTKNVVYNFPDVDVNVPVVGEQLVVASVSNTDDGLSVQLDLADVVGPRVVEAISSIVFPPTAPNMGWSYIQDLLPTNPQEGETWLERKFSTVNTVTKLNFWTSWIRFDGKWVSIDKTEYSIIRSATIPVGGTPFNLPLFVMPPQSGGVLISNMQIHWNQFGANNATNFTTFILQRTGTDETQSVNIQSYSTSGKPSNSAYLFFSESENENIFIDTASTNQIRFAFNKTGNPGTFRVNISFSLHKVRRAEQ